MLGSGDVVQGVGYGVDGVGHVYEIIDGVK